MKATEHSSLTETLTTFRRFSFFFFKDLSKVCVFYELKTTSKIQLGKFLQLKRLSLILKKEFLILISYPSHYGNGFCR